MIEVRTLINGWIKDGWVVNDQDSRLRISRLGKPGVIVVPAKMANQQSVDQLLKKLKSLSKDQNTIKSDAAPSTKKKKKKAREKTNLFSMTEYKAETKLYIKLNASVDVLEVEEFPSVVGGIIAIDAPVAVGELQRAFELIVLQKRRQGDDWSVITNIRKRLQTDPRFRQTAINSYRQACSHPHYAEYFNSLHRNLISAIS